MVGKNIGLVDIVRIFGMPYKNLAEKIKVSPKTVNDWVKERKTIPKKRLDQLSEIFGIENKEYFQKKLTEKEKNEILLLYLQRNDTIIEYEDVYVDDKGKEHYSTKGFSVNAPVIEEIQKQNKLLELFERQKNLISDEVDAGLDRNYIILDIITQVLESEDKQQKELLRIFTSYLADQLDDIWGGVHPDLSINSKYSKKVYEQLRNLPKLEN
jgi:transcriptional regulator with XRE-family HTH domain